MTAALILAGGRSRRSGRTHKSCRKSPGRPGTWVDEQIARLRAAHFAPILLVAGQRSRRAWSCVHHRTRRSVNFKSAQGGAFSSILCGLGALRMATLLVQSDTPIPPPAQVQYLRKAMRTPGVKFAQFRDQRGHGGHPVLLNKMLVNSLVQSPLPTQVSRLDRILGELEPSVRAVLSIRRYRSYPILNTRHEWLAAQAWIRQWVRKK